MYVGNSQLNNQIRTFNMGGGAAGADSGFGVPTQGPSGFRGLVENKKALALACFASLGGVLYVSLLEVSTDMKFEVINRILGI